MINTPDWTRPRINVVYPPNSFTEYERWYYENFEGEQTDREYLPIFYCGYQVNHDYGNDVQAMYELQSYVDSLPTDKKYYTISQYDNGVGVDWKGKDVLEFNMSKKGENMYPLPLIGQPHPYVFNSEKKYLCNFVGGMTHPIRNHALTLKDKEGYYISFERHDPLEYCKILSESVFTLCYRGYGINSFRIAEALQYNSIPIYISDEFIEPHNVRFQSYGCKMTVQQFDEAELFMSISRGLGLKGDTTTTQVYQELYTYEGTKDKILKHLLTLK